MERVIRKLKYDGKKVRIEYERKRKDGGDPDEFSLNSADRPAPEFDRSLQALAVDVVEICEMPATDASKLTVRGLSLTYTDGVMGACITALKGLKSSNAPLVLNTPFLPEDSEHNPTLPRASVSNIEAVLHEAWRYIDGDRAQGMLLEQSMADIRDEFIAAQPEGCDVTMSLIESGVETRSVTITKEQMKAVQERLAGSLA